MKTEVKNNHTAEYSTLPGHWVLSKLGKKVLRPGGVGLTDIMLSKLNINKDDTVVEFAPGLGHTAKKTLSKNPKGYFAIEQDEQAAQVVRTYLKKHEYRCITASVENTCLGDNVATVVYGEAMLTMQNLDTKKAIIQEAFRILKPGGRYGIQEIALTNVDDFLTKQIRIDMTKTVLNRVEPLALDEWINIFESVGFEVAFTTLRPMTLLTLPRLIEDEGLGGALIFLKNLFIHKEARQRVLEMRRTFIKYKDKLSAICVIAVKKG